MSLRHESACKTDHRLECHALEQNGPCGAGMRLTLRPGTTRKPGPARRLEQAPHHELDNFASIRQNSTSNTNASRNDILCTRQGQRQCWDNAATQLNSTHSELGTHTTLTLTLRLTAFRHVMKRNANFQLKSVRRSSGHCYSIKTCKCVVLFLPLSACVSVSACASRSNQQRKGETHCLLMWWLSFLGHC